MTRTAVMRGSTTEFDLPTLMQALSIGRQHIGIEVSDDRGALVGTVFLKGGAIVSAETKRRKGLAALRELVRAKHGHQFFVFRAEAREVPDALGSLAEVLLTLLDGDRSEATERVEMMRGRTDEVDLTSLIQAVSLGRQFVGIELVDGLGLPIGTVFLKAGKVVSAVAGDLLDLDALRLLLRNDRRTSFSVFRSSFRDEAAPLGAVDEVLRRALGGPEGAAGVQAAGGPSTPTNRPPAAVERATNGAEALGRVEAEPGPPAARAGEAPAGGSGATAAAAGGVEVRVNGQSAAAAKGSNGWASWDAPPPADEPHASWREAPPAREAPVVCLASHKGGVGRTTIAVNLAVALARRGKRVVLVDADPNDGVAVALNAQGRFDRGFYDLLGGGARADEVAVPTNLAGLRLVPAGAAAAAAEGPRDWRRAYAELRRDADLVLVDAPSGVHGRGAEALAHATHVAWVVQAEPAAVRSFVRMGRAMAAPPVGPPALLGVIINMLDYRSPSSVATLQDACRHAPPELIFDIPIARSGAFLEASARGVPLGPAAPSSPSVAWLFEVLAGTVLEKLGLWAPSFEALQLVLPRPRRPRRRRRAAARGAGASQKGHTWPRQDPRFYRGHRRRPLTRPAARPSRPARSDGRRRGA